MVIVLVSIPSLPSSCVCDMDMVTPWLDVLEGERFFEARVAGGHEDLAPGQDTHASNVYAADPGQTQHIHGMKRDMVRVEVGHDDPVEVDPVHHQHGNGPGGQH